MDLFIDFSGRVLKDIKDLLFVNWSGEKAGGKGPFLALLQGVKENSKTHKKFPENC